MNRIRELCDLYEKNQEKVGVIERGRYGEKLVLLPVFHSTVAAQITVAIDESGEFLYAEPVAEEDKMTMIPVTEKSAARTAGTEPHPLCDNLKYLAGDYMDYVIPDKEKDYSENYRLYMESLEKWAKSSFTHGKVTAIWHYLQKGELIKDLIEAGILQTNEKGKVVSDIKINKIAQTEAFVRFRIEKEWDGEIDLLDSLDSGNVPQCWLDRTLHQAYIEYCRSMERKNGLSYLTGNKEIIAYLHPKKIRNEGDGAKLFSANDETYFTFRGRFSNKEEAFSIGYEDSQKAHNALKWLIRRQGRSLNGLTLVTWESDLKELPDWGLDTDGVCDAYEAQDLWEDEEEKEAYKGANPRDASRFEAAIFGYGRKLDFRSQMILMAFDAATTGRLAMMECQSLMSSTYLKNLKSWYSDCGWLHPKFKDKTFYLYYGMAGIRDIANALYGVETNEGLALKGSNEKMYSEVCKRLLPCIVNRRDIPEDMVRLAVQKASNPLAYEKSYNWERILALACSFVKKKRIEKCSEEEWTVALKKDCDNRNYLYGRLLAVADRVEYRTFEKEENRETNAKRFMNGFSQQPFRTWRVIEERLQPYFMKLPVQERLYYSHLIEEICWQFKDGEFEKNDSLDGLYLLGYHNQSYALRNKSEEEEK